MGCLKDLFELGRQSDLYVRGLADAIYYHKWCDDGVEFWHVISFSIPFAERVYVCLS